MPNVVDSNVVKVSQSNEFGAFRVVIPKSIAKARGISKGTELLVMINDYGGIVLTKINKGDSSE